VCTKTMPIFIYPEFLNLIIHDRPDGRRSYAGIALWRWTSYTVEIKDKDDKMIHSPKCVKIPRK